MIKAPLTSADGRDVGPGRAEYGVGLARDRAQAVNHDEVARAAVERASRSDPVGVAARQVSAAEWRNERRAGCRRGNKQASFTRLPDQGLLLFF